jgi:hypothetical protein
MTHLWEVDHPGYCTDDHYYGTGSRGSPNEHYRSWADFLSEWEGSCPSRSLVFRWDWTDSTEEGYQPGPDPYYRDGLLKIFIFFQGKGSHAALEVEVCQADEPEVRKFLQARFQHLLELWAPFSCG